MTEVDIWIKVLREEGLIVKDELSRIGSDTNILELESENVNNDPSFIPLHSKIWFNYKTGKVTSARIYHNDAVNKPSLSKEEILLIKKDRFREYKIETILNE